MSRTRLFLALSAAAVLAVGLLPPQASAYPTLPVPSPLTASWVAPAGTYAPPAQVNVTCATCAVDLSAATIVGSGSGYLFKPANGTTFTLHGGTISNMTGLILEVLGTGQHSTVTLDGTTTTNVIGGVYYKVADGGRMDVTATNNTGTGYGAFVRTWGSIRATGNHIVGGGSPAQGTPAGFHAFDLNPNGVPDPTQTMYLADNYVHSFTAAGFQGDGAVSEESVSRFTALNNDFGDFADAAFDSKSQTNIYTGNVLTGSAGTTRLVGAHWGITYSVGNVYNVPAGASGIEGTAGYGDPFTPTIPGAISNGDTFNLATGARVATTQVQCTGSTGFTTVRVGVIELDHPNVSSPVVAPAQQCGGVGPVYTTSVIVR